MIFIYIYQRIRDLREDSDHTQAQIAEMLNTGTTTYRRWETGEREIPFHIVIELAKFYNVSIDYIAGLSKKTNNDWTTKKNIANNSFNNNRNSFNNSNINF